jgi:hypothetical protein
MRPSIPKRRDERNGANVTPSDRGGGFYRGGHADVIALEAARRTGLHSDTRWSRHRPAVLQRSERALREDGRGQLISSGCTATTRIHQRGIQRN